ncbi:DNA (cytosine-5-)-methyltransferase, partial [Xanthomonas citri pv. citri]|nr:DNA (cytosine-5-)-methyltransferase [Xanthomonas citri pv. citri]
GYAKQLAHCVYAEGPRHTGTDWSRNYVSYPEEGQVRRLTPLESERLQGFPDNWTNVPLAGSTEAVDSARYHACGNAV